MQCIIIIMHSTTVHYNYVRIMHCVEWYMRFVALHVPLILGVEVLHNNVAS